VGRPEILVGGVLVVMGRQRWLEERVYPVFGRLLQDRTRGRLPWLVSKIGIQHRLPVLHNGHVKTHPPITDDRSFP
jgi:hypothetical protein